MNQLFLSTQQLLTFLISDIKTSILWWLGSVSILLLLGLLYRWQRKTAHLKLAIKELSASTQTPAVPKKTGGLKPEQLKPGTVSPMAPEVLDYQDYLYLKEVREKHRQFGPVDSTTEYLSSRRAMAAELGMGATHQSQIQAHPLMRDSAYFSGVDESNLNPQAATNATAAELSEQLRYQNQPKNMPKPKPGEGFG